MQTPAEQQQPGQLLPRPTIMNHTLFRFSLSMLISVSPPLSLAFAASQANVDSTPPTATVFSAGMIGESLFSRVMLCGRNEVR